MALENKTEELTLLSNQHKAELDHLKEERTSMLEETQKLRSTMERSADEQQQFMVQMAEMTARIELQEEQIHLKNIDIENFGKGRTGKLMY